MLECNYRYPMRAEPVYSFLCVSIYRHVGHGCMSPKDGKAIEGKNGPACLTLPIHAAALIALGITVPPVAFCTWRMHFASWRGEP